MCAATLQSHLSFGLSSGRLSLGGDITAVVGLSSLAYIVMAYIVVAYIVLAYMVVAYIVVAYIVVASTSV